MDEMMFCYQCEQAANCTACTGKAGVCGKSAETADAQDKLTGALIGFATLLLDIGRPIRPPQALLLTEGLFTTITNVDFDPQTVAQLTDKVWKAKQEAFASASPAPAPVSDYDMQKLWQEPDPDRKSLCSFVLFGLRGMAAYSYHARVLGYTDGEIDLFFCTALRAIAQERDKDKLFQLVEDTGRMAYRVMAELDKANTGVFGDPEPVEVSLTIEKGPFIVISGHDLYDAKCLLEQTEGKGINVYTHSEMLPAHGYPELKKRFPHLKGNFGTAWQNQQREFEDIPAPILFTTNCIMPLRASYADRVFTTSVVAYPGVPHIDEGRDFSPVIEKALDFLPEKEKQETVKKTCQRTFQALRIDVNHEFEVLYEFMEKLPGALKPGGRVAILTFHSGEDRLVKYYFKEGKKDGLYSDVANDVIRPSAEECQRNPRARSTKMRWAIREGENSHRN